MLKKCLEFSTRWLLMAAIAGGAMVVGLPAAAAATAKPNVIFILADDLGWTDLGCYGSTFYETPNLDALASEGVRFTQAYAACNVCSPTRASILTGKSPARLNLTTWLPGRPSRPQEKLRGPAIAEQLPLEEVTLAEALKKHGYRTAFVGKWHLGGTNFFPENQGFDINIGGCHMGHPPSYFSPYRIPTLPDGPKGEHLDDRLTREALAFMTDAVKSGQPFLLYFSHYAVHTPLQGKPELVQKYEAKAEKMGAVGDEFFDMNGTRVRKVQNHPTYAAMVESMDQSVGQVLNRIRALGIETNTIVIFTSDNGGLSTAEGWPTSNVPLRAGKGWPYEGGVREPLLIKGPGVTHAGTVCEHPVISTDFYPTILEMAGLPQMAKQHVDGASFASLLKGKKRNTPPLYWHFPHYSNQGGRPHGVIRDRHWKLIEHYEDGRIELFNLSDDPGEQHDVAAQSPRKARSLLKKLHRWRESVNARMPVPNTAAK